MILDRPCPALGGGTMMIHLKFRAIEQRRHLEIHKWLMSEARGMDVGENAYVDWIKKYAARFTEWANTLPSECIGCGSCIGDTTECAEPFNEKRLSILGKSFNQWSDG